MDDPSRTTNVQLAVVLNVKMGKNKIKNN